MSGKDKRSDFQRARTSRSLTVVASTISGLAALIAVLVSLLELVGPKSPSATGTPTPTRTALPSPSPTGTATSTPTRSPAPTKTATGTPTRSATPTRPPDRTPSPTQTATTTGTATPTQTATATPTRSPSASPSSTPAEDSGDQASLPTGAVVAFGLGGVVAILAELYRRRVIVRNRRRREALADQIEESAASAASQDELRERIVTAAAPEERDVAINQVETFLLDQAHELRAVEAVIMRFPPPLPRAAKRMINHARLLTRIANERGVFGGQPPVEPAHLGKWIVLIERWPEIARAATDDPGVIGRLERAVETDGVAAALEGCGVRTRPSAELHDLLVAEPQLGDVVSRLIHFESAAIA